MQYILLIMKRQTWSPMLTESTIKMHILSGNSLFPGSSPWSGGSPWTELGCCSTFLTTEGIPQVQRLGSSQWEPHYSLMRINTIHWEARSKMPGPMGYGLKMTGSKGFLAHKDKAEGSQKCANRWSMIVIENVATIKKIHLGRAEECNTESKKWFRIEKKQLIKRQRSLKNTQRNSWTRLNLW